MIRGKLYIQDHLVNLDAERLEWILNALRGAQEDQLKLAQEASERGDLGEHRLDDSIPVEERSISINAMAREQYEVITKLREEIVAAIGYDLTDG